MSNKTNGSATQQKKTIKIKPMCKCDSCGAEVTPSKAEAGRFLMQFRKTAYDPKKMSEYGKLGGRPRKTDK